MGMDEDAVHAAAEAEVPEVVREIAVRVRAARVEQALAARDEVKRGIGEIEEHLKQEES